VTKRRLRGPGAALLALAVLSIAAPAAQAAPPPDRVVEYWIAAVPVTWNVVPNGRDAIDHVTYTPVQTTFRTVVYKAFTPNWANPIPGQGGIPGPLIRAQVGDTILVHFENLDSEFNRPHSMHFHGVHYRPGSDGAYIPGFSGPGANVKPGQSFTYRLVAKEDSVGVWPYHDHSPSMDDSIAGGLYGALSISAPGEPRPDHEFVVFFESQLGFMTIDGRAFVGNTPIFRAKVGDLVQWDVLALGDDFHTFHVHGHRWQDPSGAFRDVQTVGPADSFRIRWKEDAPGTWLYHCHVEGHMMNGMIGIYVVSPR
jgi:FtsP/CotA-like multicopper oxidase with cupredoxin domain